MIHVIASIHFQEGALPDLLKIYEAFVPKVLKEEGCIMYMPTVDREIGVHTQKLEDSVVTVIEQWETLDAFRAHLTQPHSAQFREDIKGIVDNVSIKVLENTLSE